MAKARILVVLAHPDREGSRVNRALAMAAGGAENATLHDLYALYPDFRVDKESEQALLRDADLIVFQFPLFWYSSPALLKQWIDAVFEYGFAFGKEGTALHGKSLLLAVSSGGPAEAYQAGGYNNYSMSELLKPFQQLANLAGLRYLPPFLTQGIQQLDDEALVARAEEFRELLANWTRPEAS